MTRRLTFAPIAVALMFSMVASPALGGYVTGAGASRSAHLFDGANGVEAVVPIPEVFDGFAAHTYAFTLKGSATTVQAAYRVAVVVAPGSDTEAQWNASGTGPSGNETAALQVTIPADSIQGTLANAPFAVQLLASNGTVLDSTIFSADLRYREPPADGGLLALAIASTFFWGAVLLYAWHLQRAQRKLRSRADALERSLSVQGVRDHDDERRGGAR